MEENNNTYLFSSESMDKEEQANEWAGSNPDELAALLMRDFDVTNYPEERLQQYVKSLQEYVFQTQGPHDDEGCMLIRKLIKQCAEAAAVNDIKGAYSLVKELRLRACGKGNQNERLAHHFAEALVARITGTGSSMYEVLSNTHFTTKEYSSACQKALEVTPMYGLPVFFTNQTILDEAVNAKSLHVIAYGIDHCFPYFCLIKDLSERPEGPPHLRITGVEFPNHPCCKSIKEVQLKLMSYAKQVGVSFEFHPLLSETWHTIQPRELGVRSGDNCEALFVVSIHRLRQVYDEPRLKDTPRKQLLWNIHRMKPRLFIQASYNVNCNSPSVVSRAMQYFDYLSAVFDAFEETMPRGWTERQIMEMTHGLDLLNNLACEGVDRKERPVNHKYWQKLLENAGFMQNVLRSDVYMKSKDMVGTYNKNFKLNRDGDSMLISWKNCILGAITAWKFQ